MPSMKITLSAAMRARDASRPHAEHEAAARAADTDGQLPAKPPGRRQPTAGGGTPADGSEPGKAPVPQPDSRRQQAGSGRSGGQRAGRGRGRSRRRKG